MLGVPVHAYGPNHTMHTDHILFLQLLPFFLVVMSLPHTLPHFGIRFRLCHHAFLIVHGRVFVLSHDVLMPVWRRAHAARGPDGPFFGSRGSESGLSEPSWGQNNDGLTTRLLT